MSQANFNRSPEYYANNLKRILEINAAKCRPISIFNTITKETKFYLSITKAATELGVDRHTISKYLKNKKEFQNYKFTYYTKK